MDIPQNYSHPMMPIKDAPMDAKPAQPFLLDARYDEGCLCVCLYTLVLKHISQSPASIDKSHKHRHPKIFIKK